MILEVIECFNKYIYIKVIDMYVEHTNKWDVLLYLDNIFFFLV
jgi:hypothetical protein